MSTTVQPAPGGATKTQENPLKALTGLRQSVWLDYIRRSLITGGELKRLIEEDGLRGVTSNPAIFEKAITGSNDYADVLKDTEKNKGATAEQIYERLAVRDIQDATDIMRSVYDATKKRDGYVSLEVSPYLANETKSTIAEAQRLWKAVGHENVMIKIPATPAGVPAIRQALSEGININVTLLFAQSAYEEVAHAYIEGLEAYAKSGGDVSHVASVASFFVSRIDSLIDGMLEERLKKSQSASERALLRSLMGKVAIANAKLAYQSYKDIFKGPRWEALASKGAQTQRLLWASTSTKNPHYRDVIYVEELIGADTVDTIPPATYDAFRDHGKLRRSLEEDVEAAHDTMDTLEQVGISMKQATDKLLVDGVKIFSEAFDKLLGAIDMTYIKATPAAVNTQTYTMPEALAGKVKAGLEQAKVSGMVRRMWARDAALWTGSDEGSWLGWLGITDDQVSHQDHFRKIGEEVRGEGFTHAALLGMGGSSLCPEVMKLTFGKIAGHPEMHVLDSTDPAQVLAFEKKLNVGKTIFIVSSKSGSTLEPNIFKQYFFDRASKAMGGNAGQHFVAVTDPRSKMQEVAESDGFRHIFFGWPSIGGRYSALSNFGMMPAAIQGVDVAKFLDRTEEMVHACASVIKADQNPGAILGMILGTLAKAGRDKVTIVASPKIFDIGAWLEQLLAESTGKDGRGLIPVDREALGAPEVYGQDRVFAYLRHEEAPDAKQDAAIAALEKAGQPVVRISVPDAYAIGQEMFRWEIATAIAGAVIGINAFNQPDVEASKLATRKITSEYQKTGKLPPETPVLEDSGVKLFTDEKNASALAQAAGKDKTLTGYLRAHLNRLKAGDYLALLGYIEMNDAHEATLQAMRTAIRDKKRVATCLGFGPRFLHSTGQAYKGGPNSGVFLQITCDDAVDVPIPGAKYTFGVVKAAQARGDFEVLAERNRRALRVHLGADVKAGLATLGKAIQQALA
ncbi:MAG: bifunctional transaldolase/phosoglucose isomerase [Candidatus Acidiferrales bacterium]